MSSAGRIFQLVNDFCKPRLRFAIVQAGNKSGLVSDAKIVFLCKKYTPRHNDEIDDGCYRTYVAELLHPNLFPQSVTVVNNASHHGRNVDSSVSKIGQNAKSTLAMLSIQVLQDYVSGQYSSSCFYLKRNTSEPQNKLEGSEVLAY
jgi:hypothetical protein